MYYSREPISVQKYSKFHQKLYKLLKIYQWFTYFSAKNEECHFEIVISYPNRLQQQLLSLL